MCIQEKLKMWKFPLEASVQKLCNLVVFVIGFQSMLKSNDKVGQCTASSLKWWACVS